MKKLLLLIAAMVLTIGPAAAQKGGSESKDNKIYEVVEKNASFPGGDAACYNWIAQHIQYPALAQEQGIQGRVFVQFVVNTDGTLDDVKAVRSPDPSLAEEAVRVVKSMPRWNPATQNSKAVRSRFNIPIMFRLSAPEENQDAGNGGAAANGDAKAGGQSSNSSAGAEGGDNRVFEVVEKQASFPGGNEACYAWLAKQIRYPAVAQEQGIQGRVFVQFVVNTDGSITEVKAVRSPDPSLSEEAERVVKSMPRWNPATQKGQPVRSRLNLPIMFRLTTPVQPKRTRR